MKITGTCHLILSPGCKLKCKEGSGCNKGTTLNIYSSDVTSQGTIDCDISKDNYAAIGGDEDKSSGNINIHNARIIAESNYGGAGIGGGDNGSGGEVIIAGGDVVANAGDGKSQAIGGGRRKGGGSVDIHDKMFVLAGKNKDGLQPVEAAKREYAAKNNPFVRILPCVHPDGFEYTSIDDENHKLYCKYCTENDGLIEPHEFDDNGDCIYCDYGFYTVIRKRRRHSDP